MDPRPPRPPPPLVDELVEEILLRSPPDDPARLARAALVCKRWRRLVSARAFRRRYRAFHRPRPAPMLGFLRNDVPLVARAAPWAARFVRTSAARCPPLADRRGWHALDARGGRVLLRRAADSETETGVRLAVWDPLASASGDNHRDLPVPPLPLPPRSWNAALLCDDVDDERFLVVLVGTDTQGIFACAYSSSPRGDEPGAWTQPQRLAAGGDDDHVDAVRAALVGNALHFLIQRRARILRYDLAARDMSVIDLPPASRNQRRVVLTTAEDGGGLGLAAMEGPVLCLWSMEETPGAREWRRGRSIDLRRLLPVIDLLGVADGLGIFLVGTIDGFFSVDQMSGRINKLRDQARLHEKLKVS